MVFGNSSYMLANVNIVNNNLHWANIAKSMGKTETKSRWSYFNQFDLANVNDEMKRKLKVEQGLGRSLLEKSKQSNSRR